jgi:hypothetical protein
MAEPVSSIEHIDPDTGLRSQNTRLTGTTDSTGAPAGNVVVSTEQATLKTRTPSAIGLTKKEIKFGLGDVITGAIMSCAYSSGSPVATTGNRNYMLVCFDCSGTVADALLGTSTTPVESLDADIPVYQVFPGESLSPEFNEALSYAGNAGFLGNAWVRSVDASDTIDAIIYGVDKS